MIDNDNKIIWKDPTGNLPEIRLGDVFRLREIESSVRMFLAGIEDGGAVDIGMFIRDMDELGVLQSPSLDSEIE